MVAQRIDSGSCPWSPAFGQVCLVSLLCLGSRHVHLFSFTLFVITEIFNNVSPTKISDSSSRSINWSEKLLTPERQYLLIFHSVCS